MCIYYSCRGGAWTPRPWCSRRGCEACRVYEESTSCEAWTRRLRRYPAGPWPRRAEQGKEGENYPTNPSETGPRYWLETPPTERWFKKIYIYKITMTINELTSYFIRKKRCTLSANSRSFPIAKCFSSLHSGRHHYVHRSLSALHVKQYLHSVDRRHSGAILWVFFVSIDDGNHH